jgi:hypothetical protein
VYIIKVIIKKYEDLKKNIGLSISSFGDIKYPIITIRHHNRTSDDILNYKKFIISDLENNGFKISDKIQRELTVYDTYPEEDDGWISKL